MAREFVAASSQLAGPVSISVSLPFTFAMWVRPTNLGSGSTRVLMAVSDGSFNNFCALRLQSDGTIEAVAANSGGGSSSITGGAASNGVWAHGAAVFSGTTGRTAYINGTAATENTASRAVSGLSSVEVGRVVSVQFLDGSGAEAGLWSVALSTAEIAALAKRYDPRLIRPQSLVAYWQFTGNESPELDRWKNKYDQTLTNAPAKADHPPMIYAY